jgi:DNA-binding LacI/PurR family transcriptional regulator
MTGRPGVPCAKERLVGYRKAMAAAGLRIDPRWETCGYFQMEDALRAARAMLDELPEPPTAVFACSDAIALGVYHPGGPVQHRFRLKVSCVTSRFTPN